jgi:hypothetical protein
MSTSGTGKHGGSNEVKASELSWELAVNRYYLDDLLARPPCPIDAVQFTDINQSMRGGGPACLRLRVVLTDDQIRGVAGDVIMSDALYDKLRAVISQAYPEAVSFAELADPGFADRCWAATAVVYKMCHPLFLKRCNGHARDARMKITKRFLPFSALMLIVVISSWAMVSKVIIDQRPEDWTTITSFLKLKEISLGMHKYHAEHGRLPLAAVFAENGKPLLSWRVLLLPYIEQGKLYRQFKMNEAWDSPHNIKLLPNIPNTYSPVEEFPPHEAFTTFYQIFVGKGTPFEGRNGLRLEDVRSRLDNTFLIVEAANAVPWTKPEDLPYDETEPLPKLGGLHKGFFYASLLDSSARTVSQKTDERVLRAAIVLHGSGPGKDW